MNLRIEQEGRLRRIVLAAPEQRNLLDAVMCQDLLSELRDAAADGGKRPAYLEIPDLQAAIGYVLHIIAARRYSRVLAQCKFDDCGNFFLRAPSSAAGMLLLRGARETRQARRDRRSWA